MNWAQLSFQDAMSPTMKALIFLHDAAMTLIFLIMMYVVVSMLATTLNQFSSANTQEQHILEIVWTILPASVLIMLAMPSLQLLYLFDETSNPILTLKTVGHQWYWTYDYADFWNSEFDSYMTPTMDLANGDFRLLEVDNRMVLPWGVETRLLITAADVLHSWTIPSMGVKADAAPGRLNQTSLLPLKPGVFYGQCSEICGANHSFMPISLETTHSNDWTQWISTIMNKS